MATSNFDYNGWQNGANWYNMAKALKKASDKIREAYLVAYRNVDIGKQVHPVPGGFKVNIDTTKLDIDDLDQYPVAMLLMGYAMENIFKGIIVCGMWLEDPKSVDMADFDELDVPVKGSTQTMHLMEHGLRRLLDSKAMMNIKFDDPEKDMMDTLDIFIRWGGRYATPKEYDPADPLGLKRLEPIEYPYQALDSLYVKSMEELIKLCKLQGDKLSG
jgi:hypothetical protein